MNKDKFMNDPEKNNRKGAWSCIEQNKFKESLFLFSKNWINIKEYIKTRSLEQCKSHSQKYFKSIKKNFFNDLYKSRIETKNIKSFTEKWVNDLLNFEYLDLINLLNLGNEDYINKYKLERLHKLIFNIILGIKQNKAYNCESINDRKYLNECNSEFNSTRNISEFETENSSTYLNKKIFKIPKLNKPNIPYLTNNISNIEDFSPSETKSIDLIKLNSSDINIEEIILSKQPSNKISPNTTDYQLNEINSFFEKKTKEEGMQISYFPLFTDDNLDLDLNSDIGSTNPNYFLPSN